MLATEVFVKRASFRECDAEGNAEGNEECLSQCMKELQFEKERLPALIQRIGRQAWNRLVNRDLPPPASSDRGSRRSRAYHKMSEINMSCALPHPSRSVHLCESPGGFVEATLYHTSHPNWTWKALSLGGEGSIPPAYERLPTQRGVFLLHDIFDVEWFANHLPHSDADLVTADGAVEMDHSRLEEEHFPLLLRQTQCALACLSVGGTFVIKFFEGARSDTRRWVALLTHCFDTVSIIKPKSSRATNSERYLVGRGFRKATPLRPACISLNSSWDEEVGWIMDAFAKAQTLALRNSVRHAG